MLTLAKNRAIDFLISRRDKDGWWRDFDTLAGSSDEWVTAYVGCMLAALDDVRARRAARESWRALQRRRWWSAGWGYNAYVPADADTTLWALRLAHHIGAKRSIRVSRAMRFIARHIRVNGGLATYARDRRIRLFTRLQPDISFDGWCNAHHCVTAAAASLPVFKWRARVLDYLRRTQCPDGSWKGYWWCDPEYTTALAVEALALDGGAANLTCVERAVSWAAERVTHNGCAVSSHSGTESASATAWCIRILTRAPEKRQVRRAFEAAVSRLLSMQLTDGDWPASAWLRIPPPYIVDPESYVGWIFNGRGGGSVQVDVNGCFTTASVLCALQEAERQLD